MRSSTKRVRSCAAAIAVLWLAVVAEAPAQTVLTMPDVYESEFTDSSATIVIGDTVRAQEFVYTARAGERFILRMHGRSFQPYAAVFREQADGKWKEHDARRIWDDNTLVLGVVAADSGEYHILAATGHKTDRGAFTLSLYNESYPPQTRPIWQVAGRKVPPEFQITADDPTFEDWKVENAPGNDEQHFHAFAVSLNRGDTIDFMLRSRSFLARLLLARYDNGKFVQIADAPQVIGRNPFIRFVAPAAATYIVAASPIDNTKTGFYELSFYMPPVPVNVCILEDNTLKTVSAKRYPGNGDLYVGSREVRYSHDFAVNRDWFIHNEPIVFNGKRYEKYGLPRVLSMSDIVKRGEFDGLAMYAEPGKDDVVYVYMGPHEYCAFQPYRHQQ